MGDIGGTRASKEGSQGCLRGGGGGGGGGHGGGGGEMVRSHKMVGGCAER